MTVHVFPMKQIVIATQNTNINKGQSTVLKVNTGTNLVWSGTDIINNWGDSILVKPASTTVYKVIGTNADGCRDTAEITINVSNVGLEGSAARQGEFQIYPNPVNELLMVNCKVLMQENSTFIIVNTLGQTLLQGVLKEKICPVNISKLAPGIYFIKVGDELRKFVKE